MLLDCQNCSAETNILIPVTAAVVSPLFGGAAGVVGLAGAGFLIWTGLRMPGFPPGKLAPARPTPDLP
ncbi:MAG TPA: hypothetical protein VKT21_07310 [Thermoplasmata archaeon]|nr:hypothetical protein [Thermoplasmata archaeon]